MTLNSLIIFIAAVLLLIVGFSIAKDLLKRRKRSAKSIYKLIDDLEKKIYLLN